MATGTQRRWRWHFWLMGNVCHNNGAPAFSSPSLLQWRGSPLSLPFLPPDLMWCGTVWRRDLIKLPGNCKSPGDIIFTLIPCFGNRRIIRRMASFGKVPTESFEWNRYLYATSGQLRGQSGRCVVPPVVSSFRMLTVVWLAHYWFLKSCQWPLLGPWGDWSFLNGLLLNCGENCSTVQNAKLTNLFSPLFWCFLPFYFE